MVDALKRNVQIHPHWPVYRFLDDKGKVSDFITCYGALHTAQSVAAWLVDGLGLKPGDRVALVYPPGVLLLAEASMSPRQCCFDVLSLEHPSGISCQEPWHWTAHSQVLWPSWRVQ